MMNNFDLLDRLERALGFLYGRDNDAIVRILADLRHLCDRKGLSFAVLDQAAQEHYLADIGQRTIWTVEEILKNEG